MSEVVERRRHSRLATQEAHLSLSVLLEVEILDISVSGLMFSSEGELAVGQRVRVLTLLGGERFSAWVDVRRVERESPLSPQGRRCRYGASFASIEEKSQRTLRRFLGAGSPEA